MENGSSSRFIWVSVELSDVNHAIKLIAKHPFINDSKYATEIASVLLMVEHFGKVIPISNNKAFLKVYGPKRVDDRWGFITRQILSRLDHLDRIFLDKSPTRGSNEPSRILLIDRFIRKANTKTHSKKVKAQIPAWFDDYYAKEKTFKQMTSVKTFDKYLEKLMVTFEKDILKPWRDKTVQFSPEQRFQIIDRTDGFCQWKFPDGSTCGFKPEYDEGEIDHTVPRRLGGATTPENARWICRIRNRTRGKRCMHDTTP